MASSSSSFFVRTSKRVNFLKRNAKYTAPSKEMIFLLLPSLPPTEAEAEGELPAAAGGGDRPQSSNIISASGFSGNETRSLLLLLPLPPNGFAFCAATAAAQKDTQRRILFFSQASPPSSSPFNLCVSLIAVNCKRSKKERRRGKREEGTTISSTARNCT